SSGFSLLLGNPWLLPHFQAHLGRDRPAIAAAAMATQAAWAAVLLIAASAVTLSADVPVVSEADGCESPYWHNVQQLLAGPSWPPDAATVHRLFEEEVGSVQICPPFLIDVTVNKIN
ncbi:unnamed protein product, partial [Polarella glacialis]